MGGVGGGGAANGADVFTFWATERLRAARLCANDVQNFGLVETKVPGWDAEIGIREFVRDSFVMPHLSHISCTCAVLCFHIFDFMR